MPKQHHRERSETVTDDTPNLTDEKLEKSNIFSNLSVSLLASSFKSFTT